MYQELFDGSFNLAKRLKEGKFSFNQHDKDNKQFSVSRGYSFSGNVILGVSEPIGEVAISTIVKKSLEPVTTGSNALIDGIAGCIVSAPATLISKGLNTLNPHSPSWELTTKLITMPIVFLGAGPISASAYLVWGLIKWAIRMNKES